ncbi:CatB-related O-acetyltransferase [Amycolatopsis pigmentata]|uniref:Chloramphenicol acetyltransferase n=1 Tax=Amycolatopsis pigmentata TaxID=450801 RepID=A0ABW5G1J6_9PSEU
MVRRPRHRFGKAALCAIIDAVFRDLTQVQRLDLDPEIARHPLIELEDGRYCWYSGFYHQESFAQRVRYVFAEPERYENFDGPPFDKLRIGNFCQFASGCVFMLGGNHGHDAKAVTPYGFFSIFEGARNCIAPVGDTVVGHEVWIGYEALVMPGVRIGTGAIIGSRAVVSRDVAPFSIVVADNKVVRHRFDPLSRKLLWRIGWWTWPDERISEALPLLQGHDVRALAEFAGVTPEEVVGDPDPAEQASPDFSGA